MPHNGSGRLNIEGGNQIKKWFLLIVSVAALVALLAGGGLLAAQTPPPTPTATPTPALAELKVQGKVTAVDVRSSKITITPAQGAAVTLNVIGDTRIQLWGNQTPTLADITVGMDAKALYGLANFNALRVQVEKRGQPDKGPRQAVVGVVKSIATSSFAVETKQGMGNPILTITIDANTQFWAPPRKDARLSDLKVGDRVALLASKKDSAILAERVLIMPSRPTHEQIKAVITRITGSEITLSFDKDKTVVADAPPGIARRLQVGDLVTALIIRTPGTEKVMIKDVEASDKLVDRLNSHASGKSGKDKEALTQLVEKNKQKHQDILQSVRSRVPEAARAGIDKALQRSKGQGVGLGAGNAGGGRGKAETEPKGGSEERSQRGQGKAR